MTVSLIQDITLTFNSSTTKSVPNLLYTQNVQNQSQNRTTKNNENPIENQKIELANIKLKDDMTVHQVLHMSPLKIKGVPTYIDTPEVKLVLHYQIS